VKLMFEIIFWAIFFYIAYKIIRNSIQNAVIKGIRDYEKRKEASKQKEREILIDKKKIQDAEFKDL
jgi:hypothetical protein